MNRRCGNLTCCTHLLPMRGYKRRGWKHQQKHTNTQIRYSSLPRNKIKWRIFLSQSLFAFSWWQPRWLFLMALLRWLLKWNATHHSSRHAQQHFLGWRPVRHVATSWERHNHATVNISMIQIWGVSWILVRLKELLNPATLASQLRLTALNRNPTYLSLDSSTRIKYCYVSLV